MQTRDVHVYMIDTMGGNSRLLSRYRFCVYSYSTASHSGFPDDGALQRCRSRDGSRHLAQRAEHPVGNGAQISSMLFESLGQILAFVHQ
jgi:hypothetical protein